MIEHRVNIFNRVCVIINSYDEKKGKEKKGREGNGRNVFLPVGD